MEAEMHYNISAYLLLRGYLMDNRPIGVFDSGLGGLTAPEADAPLGNGFADVQWIIDPSAFLIRALVA